MCKDRSGPTVPRGPTTPPRGSGAVLRRASRDGGMVTAEIAVVMPVLVVVLAMAIFALACVSAQLRCVDAARASARVAARGESQAAVVTAGRSLAPPAASVLVTTTGQLVQVDVSATVNPFSGVLRKIPGVPVTARAVAVVEDARDDGS